jgi:hypothetical protein
MNAGSQAGAGDGEARAERWIPYPRAGSSSPVSGGLGKPSKMWVFPRPEVAGMDGLARAVTEPH